MAESKKFWAWVTREAARLAGEKSVEEKVEEALAPENLKIERRNAEGKWEDWK